MVSFHIQAFKSCVAGKVGKKPNREFSITLQAVTGALELTMPEAVAAMLVEKLQALDLAPSGMSKPMKLS
ncbi:MAG: hypothetical protein H7X74_00465 [Methyloceanibacter sp.]|nr:hypothetical protein [Methyloceanibacter sp.]